MNTTDTEWEKEELVRKAERDIEFVVSNPDMYDISVQVKNIIRTALFSRDTYWKERVEAVEAVLMEQYKNALQSNEDGEANGYAHSLAIVKDLHREFTNEDNLK